MVVFSLSRHFQFIHIVCWCSGWDLRMSPSCAQSQASSCLSGPNRAMQPRCAMRFESHIPKSLAMRKSFFASDAKTHPLDLKSQENARKKSLRKSCDVGLRCKKSGCFLRSSDAKCLRFGLPLRFGLRCEHPRCQIASDVGRAMRATKARAFL